MATKVKISKRIADKVRELNSSGVLKLELRLGKVATQLATLSEETALDVLNNILEVEAAAADPNTFVIESAKAIQQQEEELASMEAGGEEEPEDDALAPAAWGEEGEYGEGEVGEEGQAGEGTFESECAAAAALLPSVKDFALSLNTSGKLISPLDMDKCSGPLSLLGEAVALQFLRDVDENADMIDKPTHLVCDACKKIFESGMGTVDAKAAAAFGQLMRKIRWINGNVQLAFPLHMGNILEILRPLDHQAASAVLKELVENAEEIEGPQSWLRQKVREKMKGGKSKGKGKNKSKTKQKAGTKGKTFGNGKDKQAGAKGKGKSAAKELTASERKVMRTLVFLNQHWLPEPVTYMKVKKDLDKLDEKNQLKVLEQMKQKASAGQVKSAENWIRAACKKMADAYEQHVAAKRKMKGKGKGADKGSAPPAKRKKGGKGGNGSKGTVEADIPQSAEVEGEDELQEDAEAATYEEGAEEAAEEEFPWDDVQT
eukprot:TRINITY_DN48379_c0_g1_i1.p1 TRINITY_DN48379_c0_g1~~TRINITY_DN48379_c0_g1_i1.p1  ORF type:complete len:513 (-),score=154.78 TRINITY_DN48379_c0_g1_i1:65-1528(-)